MTKRETAPPRFKKWRPAKAHRPPLLAAREKRDSPRLRGYDHRWDKLSDAYRRLHPFCEECDRRGGHQVCDCVDHIIPVVDRPDLKFEISNLQSLCKAHHDVWKARLENHARTTNQLDKLPAWCRDPKTRPNGFRLDL
jgi:hypothetical protein